MIDQELKEVQKSKKFTLDAPSLNQYMNNLAINSKTGSMENSKDKTSPHVMSSIRDLDPSKGPSIISQLNMINQRRNRRSHSMVSSLEKLRTKNNLLSIEKNLLNKN